MKYKNEIFEPYMYMTVNERILWADSIQFESRITPSGILHFVLNGVSESQININQLMGIFFNDELIEIREAFIEKFVNPYKFLVDEASSFEFLELPKELRLKAAMDRLSGE